MSKQVRFYFAGNPSNNLSFTAQNEWDIDGFLSSPTAVFVFEDVVSNKTYHIPSRSVIWIEEE